MNLRVLRTADFWAGLLLISVGSIYVQQSQEIFEPTAMSDVLGPRTFPFLVGVALALVGAGVTIRVLLQGGQRADLGRLDVLFVLVAACIAYILVFLRLGYILSTVIFLAFLFSYLGERRHWMTAIVAVGITLGLYYGFHDLLIVDLPKGPLGF